MIFNLFSTKKESYLNNEEKKKFELVSCPRNGIYCKNILPALNKCYADFDVLYQDKEYNKSIDALKNAYNKTLELPESPCSNCAANFRSAISDSVENIHCELKSMSEGLFSTNRFHSSYEKAEQVLSEIKNEKKELKYAV